MEQQKPIDERQSSRPSGDAQQQPPRPMNIMELLPEPQSLEELNITPALVIDLILRLMRQEGEVSVRRMMDVLRLGLKLLDAVLLKMQQEHQVEISRAGNLGRASYVYRLTEDGGERAREAVDRTQYIGPVPVSVDQYSQAIMIQTRVRRRVPAEMMQEARVSDFLGEPLMVLVLSPPILSRVALL